MGISAGAEGMGLAMMSPVRRISLPRRGGVELSDYLPIAMMLGLAVVFAGVSLLVSYLISYKRPTAEKLEPYECGIITEAEPIQRFSVKFYLVAILFVIFDVEIIFLFAWASVFGDLGWGGVAAMAIFTLLIVETLGYVWKRGALDWNEAPRARFQPAEATVGDRNP